LLQKISKYDRMLAYQSKGVLAMTDTWVTMREASQELGVSPSKISRLAAIKAIEVRSDEIDRRIKLVNLEQVKAILNRRNARQ
jgi:hypothetical protein